MPDEARPFAQGVDRGEIADKGVGVLAQVDDADRAADPRRGRRRRGARDQVGHRCASVASTSTLPPAFTVGAGLVTRSRCSPI